MSSFMQDMRLALRGMRKSPTFTLVAVLSMALGIGATTAIFSVMHEMLLKSLPVRHPEQLVNLRELHGEDRWPVRPANFFDWQQRTHVFSEVGLSRDNPPYILTGTGEPVSILGYRYSANMFDVFGVKPLLGRTFTADEDKPGNDNVVVLGYKIWQKQFGGDKNVIGRSITMSGRPYTIIGVMPKGFPSPGSSLELWTPLALSPAVRDDRQHSILRPVGRLREGVTLEQAKQELNAVAKQLEQSNPETNKDWRVAVLSIRDSYSEDIKPVLLALFSAVSLLLVIACTNVANLLMAKASDRRREFSIRVALGASRTRLVRQLLSESVTLSLLGGLLGLFLALWGTRVLIGMLPTNIANLGIPNIEEIPLSAPVLFFCLAVTVSTGILFGLLPALQSSGKDVTSGLHESSAAFSASRRGRRTRNALIIAEISVALVLLTGAGLALKSYKRLSALQFGFDSDHLLTFYLNMPPHKYPDASARRAYMDKLLATLAAVPGVKSAGASAYLPLSGFGGGFNFDIEGQEVRVGERPAAGAQFVTHGYFEALRIPLLAGRTFTPNDTPASPEVAIVDKSFAHRYFGDSDPVGHRLNLGETPDKPEWVQIVGVVGDVKESGLDVEVGPEIYVDYAQSPAPWMGFALRTEVDPESLASTVRQAVWSIDKDQPITRLITMEEAVNESMAIRRITTSLMTVFAFISLALACVGIYGVIAYSVAQRTHEFGIRLALGATRANLTNLVLSHAAKLCMVGIAIGLALSVILARFATALVYGISTRDPGTYLLTPLVLGGIALIASLVPAWRASRLNPVSALRQE